MGAIGVASKSVAPSSPSTLRRLPPSGPAAGCSDGAVGADDPSDAPGDSCWCSRSAPKPTPCDSQCPVAPRVGSSRAPEVDSLPAAGTTSGRLVEADTAAERCTVAVTAARAAEVVAAARSSSYARRGSPDADAGAEGLVPLGMGSYQEKTAPAGAGARRACDECVRSPSSSSSCGSLRARRADGGRRPARACEGEAKVGWIDAEGTEANGGRCTCEDAGDGGGDGDPDDMPWWRAGRSRLGPLTPTGPGSNVARVADERWCARCDTADAPSSEARDRSGSVARVEADETGSPCCVPSGDSTGGEAAERPGRAGFLATRAPVTVLPVKYGDRTTGLGERKRAAGAAECGSKGEERSAVLSS